MKAFVASNDAGGAEVLSEFLIFKKIKFSGIFSGPAIEIFKKKFRNTLKIESLESIKNFEHVFVGTSGVAKLELEAIKKARLFGIKSTAIIDDISNFKLRFHRNGAFIFPDEILVDSENAKKELLQNYPNLSIKVEENYYLKKFKFIDKNHKNIMLYLADPISTHALKYFGNSKYYGFDEFEAIELFLENFKYIDSNIEKIVIRPHPDEDIEKYFYLIEKFNWIYININKENDLLEQVRDAKIIVGCANNAMMAAAESGKKVISLLPQRIVNFGVNADKYEILKF